MRAIRPENTADLVNTADMLDTYAANALGHVPLSGQSAQSGFRA